MKSGILGIRVHIIVMIEICELCVNYVRIMCIMRIICILEQCEKMFFILQLQGRHRWIDGDERKEHFWCVEMG